MSRSVSTHPNAVATVFLTPEIEEGGWDDFLDDLRTNIFAHYWPSLRDCDRWEGRENHVIANNAHCEVSVSEYCGLVAICLAPYDGDYRTEVFNRGWTESFAPHFVLKLENAYASCVLRSQGHASNGEQFFTRVGKPGSCVTSKEGDLW